MSTVRDPDKAKALDGFLLPFLSIMNMPEFVLQLSLSFIELIVNFLLRLKIYFILCGLFCVLFIGWWGQGSEI